MHTSIFSPPRIGRTGLPTLFAELTDELRRAAIEYPSGPFSFEVVEHDDRYEVEVDVPGATKEQVKISFQRPRVVIEVERSEQPRESGRRILSTRPAPGVARQVFTFRDLATEGHDASITNGVLVLSLKKRTVPQDREIPIR